jgi:hypothetical protein
VVVSRPAAAEEILTRALTPALSRKREREVGERGRREREKP